MLLTKYIYTTVLHFAKLTLSLRLQSELGFRGRTVKGTGCQVNWVLLVSEDKHALLKHHTFGIDY